MMKRMTTVTLLGSFLVASAAFGAHARQAPNVKSPHKKLSRECETCHLPTSFEEISFDHEDTGFRLEGAHARTACLSCHSIEDFTLVEKSCVSCHEDVHLGELGVTCEKCHTARAWNVFDGEEIHSRTTFPLLGRHLLVDCDGCHRGRQLSDFSNTSSNCVSCHQGDYLAAARPNHVSSGFSTQCEECHQMMGWQPARMVDHDIFFPIFSGTHRSTWDDCVICHTDPGDNSIFSCLNCHEHDQTPMDDAHQGMAGYAYASQECYSCHPTGEAGQFVDHDAQFFPIFSGRHQDKWSECQECHNDPANPAVFTCLSCHEHEQTRMDGAHLGMPGYAYASSQCLSCHPTGEKGQFLEHDPQFFPIFSGTHRSQWGNCDECHNDPTTRAVFTCLSCHQHEQTAMDGVHGGMVGYSYASSECYFCHPTGNAAQFVEHDAQFFPIFSGTHLSQWSSCDECHNDPTTRSVFTCLSCHAHEQTAMDGVHGGMPGYAYNSSQCLSCHPTGVAGQFLEHDAQFFPVYSGTHRSQWSTCEECHNDPTTRAVFTCLSCHAHEQTAMDGVHGGMPGYAYNSSQCLSCHPTGNAGQFLEHDAQFFPIYSGTHRSQWVTCDECHNDPANRSAFSCLVCHAHEQTAMDGVHQGMSGYAYNSSQCLSCHPTGNAGRFLEHDSQFFPIYSGRHQGRWDGCEICHNDPADRSVVTCLLCHEHSQQRMDDVHRGRNGYSYTTGACLNCHPDGRG